MDKPNFTDLLKNINMSSNDFFHNENKNYLYNLSNSIIQIISNLKLVFISDISATFIKHIQPICIRPDSPNNLLYLHCENQPEQKHINKLEMELDDILKNINLLLMNIPCYYNMNKSQLKEILNELVLFHNNVVNKIKWFLNFTSEYHNQMHWICIFLEKNYKINKINLQMLLNKRNNQLLNSIKTVGIELFGNSDNNNELSHSSLFTNTIGVYHQQSKKSKQIDKQEQVVKNLHEYFEHYTEQVKLFDNIKIIGKQIDKTFLTRLQTYISTM